MIVVASSSAAAKRAPSTAGVGVERPEAVTVCSVDAVVVVYGAGDALASASTAKSTDASPERILKSG